MLSSFLIDVESLDAFARDARDAGVSFTNVVATDARGFGVVVAFDATSADVRRYATTYDAHDAIYRV